MRAVFFPNASSCGLRCALACIYLHAHDCIDRGVVTLARLRTRTHSQITSADTHTHLWREGSESKIELVIALGAGKFQPKTMKSGRLIRQSYLRGGYQLLNLCARGTGDGLGNK